MPQLDFSTPLTTGQVVWGAVIFVVLYLLLSRWALPQVGAVLEKRAVHIAATSTRRRRRRRRPTRAVAELTAATASARAEAQAAVNQAADQAKRRPRRRRRR